MSANIYYRQVKPIEGVRVSCWAPSSFMETMEKAFGNYPVILSKVDIPKLTGMAAMNGDGDGNPYQELIGVIEQLGEIEVFSIF